MKNGQLKPAYNVQISTSNQFIVNYSIHQQTTDTNTLKEHLSQHLQSFRAAPRLLTADAGYGSEENYMLLKESGTEAYVKYPLFDRAQRSSMQAKQPFAPEKLYYHPQGDYYVCPMGQKMTYIRDRIHKTATGFLQTYRQYQAQNCSTCPLNGACHKSEGNRIIQINTNLQQLKEKVDRLLKSEQGIEKRKKRCFEVEPVFGNIKNNHHFRRFMLRGKQKVEIEWGLLAIAQNIRKKVG